MIDPFYAAHLNKLRKLIANTSVAQRLKVFQDCIRKIVVLVAMGHGLLKPDAVDELREMALAHSNFGLDEDTINKMIGDGFAPDDQIGVSLDDFYAYMLTHSYIFVPTGDLWPGSCVNARIAPVPLVDEIGAPVLDDKGNQKTVSATNWLDQTKPVEQMTWVPAEPKIIEDKLISGGGWIDRKDVRCFNLYRPPKIEPGDRDKAGQWIDHANKVFPDDADHIIKWLAHRRQRPKEKINHALVLGGAQGIGKDTLLEPVKRAIGPWNFDEVSPQHLLGRFNGFWKSVILRVNEARDLGEMNRYQFYEHMKAYTASPPDVLRIDEKNIREYSIPNCCGIIITTNHKADGIYLPADDRRHYVAWSDCTKEQIDQSYWDQLWKWYDSGGDRNVATFLATLDISSFNPKTPPPKTQAFRDIVDANRAPEDAELQDVLDELENPKATTLARVTSRAEGDFHDWLIDRKNRRVIPHRFEMCGYTPIRNDTAKDGLWVINNKRQVVYAKTPLSVRDRLQAARDLVKPLAV
jgi:hypothetical protein